MEMNKMEKRITIRLTDEQLKILDEIKAKVVPYQNRSEIVRTILEIIHAKIVKNEIVERC